METTREIRALTIAATTMLRPGQGGWSVPSQSGGRPYKVDPVARFCTCADHETRGIACKHILAVEFTIRREKGKGGVYRVTEEKVKVTYTQQWSAYNAAQCEEKDRFVQLLADLCSGVVQPPSGINGGRPRLPLSDMTFACTYKVYSRFSSRRFTSDLRAVQEQGLISRVPHFNSVSHHMSSPALTPVLKELITLSSLPLKAVETDFAVDSSGFSTSRFIKWFNKKYGKEVDNREWVKVHLMCGVNTTIVTSAEMSGWAAADTNFFRPLLDATAANFAISEVSADKAYLSHDNATAVEGVGAVPFVPFKSNTVPVKASEDSAWARMYHRFAYDREAFQASYHKRSNVETTFSMIKSKFGDAVLSKSDTGQMNEVLAKVLAHNICVVIGAIHELGIEVPFGRVA
ncbi:MAG: transposase [Acidimicrobiales bacterium]